MEQESKEEAKEMHETKGEDILQKRKENLKEKLKFKKEYFQYVLLGILIWFSTNMRLQNLPLLKDITTGAYTPQELDSYLFMRYARYIVEHGSLFTMDTMRSYPLGSNIANLGTLTSYFEAYLFKLLKMFSQSITIEYIVVIYPVVAMAIITIFLFLLVRRMFEWKTAILSCIILNIIPSFLYRSTAGFSDHDALGMALLVLTFYLYVRAWQSKETKYNILFGALAGITTILGLLTAGSTNIIFLIIGMFTIIEIFLNKFEKKDYYSLASWTASFVLFYACIKGLVVSQELMSSLTSGTAILALGIASVDFFIIKKKLLKLPETLTKRLPEGVIGLVLTLAVGSIILLIISGPDFFVNKIQGIYTFVFKTFSQSRWALTVAENKRPFVTDWIGDMTKPFVFAFIAGSILLFYEAVKELKEKLWYELSYAKILTITYTLFIFGYIFSRYSQGSILNGDSTLSKYLFFGSIILFVVVLVTSYLQAFYRDKKAFEEISKIDKKYAFIFIWFFILIIAATSAIRLMFEFSIVISILAAFIIVEGIKFFCKQKNEIIKYAGMVAIAIMLVSPFAIAPQSINPLHFDKGVLLKFYENSDSQAKYMGLSYNQQWQEAGKWVRENTPENSAFAHWWDYGYWVQTGFERPTITDGGNRIGWWNYLMGRNVLTGKNEDEALPFLYAHNASYLLIVADEIGKYPAYSSIGSDKDMDRFSWAPAFTLKEDAVKETRDSIVLAYEGAFPFDEDIIYEGKVLPKEQAATAGVFVPIKNIELKKDNQTTQVQEIQQPIAVVIYQGQRIDLPMKCVYYQGKLMEFPEYKLEHCLAIIPAINPQNQGNTLGAGIYLSRKGLNANWARLYLLNQEKEFPHLKEVYNDKNMMPLALYNGRIIGPHRIWKIEYPKNMKLRDEEMKYYLRTDYPEPELQ